MAAELSTLGLSDAGEVLHVLLDHSPDLVVITDTDGTILFRNRDVGQNPGVIGTSGFSYVAEVDRGHVEELCREVVATASARSYDVRAPRPGGRFVVYRTRIAPVCREDRVTALLFIATDVTAQMEAQRSLIERDEQLCQVQRMDAMAHLVAGLAHNFNNLLTAILTNLDRAARRGGDATAPAVAGAREAAGRAARLVSDLLVFAGKRPVGSRPRQDLSQTVRHVVAMFQSTMDDDVAVELDIDPAMPDLDVPDQMEQVVFNLLLNARDAVAGTGRTPHVRIELGPSEADTVELRVRDNGVGMDRDVMERVFEPFFTTKDAGRGTGLGLATAYRIVHEQGGVLTCASEPGRGSAFTIALPRRPVETRLAAAHDTAAARPSTIEPGQPRPTVLVVDDEDLVRRALSELLRDHGYQVLEAADGAAGLAAFLDHQREIDLVLVDQTMPTMSGTQLLERIRRLDQRVKAVLITGYAAERRAAQLVQAVLPKPIESADLIDCVERVLGGDTPLRRPGSAA